MTNNLGRIGGSGVYDFSVNNTGTIFAQGGVFEVTGTISGAGLLEVDAAGILKLDGPVSGQTLTFTDNTGAVVIGNIAQFSLTQVTGYTPGDHFYIPGAASVLQSFNPGTGVLSITDASFTPLGTLTFSGSHTTADFTGAVIAGAPCYRAGTRIRTDRGEVPVESLQVGDQVVSALGGMAEIVWLGHRRVDCRRHPQPLDVWPVRIAAGAFGEGLPGRDLYLSPDHAVFADGVLIPVRHLVNGATITQEKLARVTYWHVELKMHDVIIAEGMPAESYLDTGNRGAFANSSTPVMFNPDFSLRVWEAESCAPLVRDGAELVAVRSMLLERAQALGHILLVDPDPYLLVDGEIVRRQMILGPIHRFVIPRTNFDEIRIVSPSAVAAETLADSDDPRRLGVKISGVAAFRPW